MSHPNDDENRLPQEVILLASIAELLNSLDLDTVLARTLSLLTESVGADRGSFFVFSPTSTTAERYIIHRDLPPERSQMVVEQVLQSGLAGWVYRQRQAALVNDTLNDPRWVTFPDDPLPIRSALCVPFMVAERINGIMTLECFQPGQFTEADLRLATTVANQAALTLHNAQLFHRVETQQRQLQAVLQSTHAPILTVTASGQIRLANPAALAMIGLSASSITGQPLEALEHCAVCPAVAQRIAAGETRFELHDETAQRDYDVQVSSWREGDSGEAGYVIVFNDITTLKDLDRLKTQMIRTTSHDLRNPLMVILGYTEMMLAELDPDSPQFERVAEITKVTQRMLDTVTQLLSLERIESTIRGAGELFCPLDLIQDVVAGLAPLVARKGHMVTIHLPETRPRVRGAPALLREAFLNLIDNAIQYTPDGGQIDVHASVDWERRRFDFAVEDNGYGIPRHLQADLFKQFYRARQPGTERIPGTGLGLSLVKATVEHHGGEVWFESAPGVGSTFGFWLPLPEGEEALETGGA